MGLALEARSRATVAAHRRDVALAWTIEALARTQKLPALATLLAEPRARRPQSADELRAVMRALARGRVHG